MIPWEVLGEADAPDGSRLSLTRRGHEYVILANGKSLMSNRMHGSEEALAAFGLKSLPSFAEASTSAKASASALASADKPADRPEGTLRVLVGGLGMGYTLRAALDRLPPGASVDVAELVPAVVEWNRGPLGPLAGHPLADKRVRVIQGDVLNTLRAHPGAFDAILLDVDNGPAAFTTDFNGTLYANAGVAAARDALKPEGTLAVWSAWDDRKFEQRLRYAGFAVSVEHVRARLKQGGPYHTIFVARLP